MHERRTQQDALLRSKIAPWRQKKWSQLSESTRRAKPDEEPERSNATAQAISEVPTWCGATATDNQVRIALLATANEQSDDTWQKQRQNLFCKMFFGVYQSNSHGIRAKKMEPIIGIEPMTYSLRVNCSTDWAKLASSRHVIEYSAKNKYCQIITGLFSGKRVVFPVYVWYFNSDTSFGYSLEFYWWIKYRLYSA